MYLYILDLELYKRTNTKKFKTLCIQRIHIKIEETVYLIYHSCIINL